jgi:energy-coupling factor transporter transmembrane protein EcfT
MHPVIRILCFLSLITALARANFPFILLADGIFLLFVLRASSDIFAFTWRLMRRMRWFWLSIILLYVLMTPGGGPSFILGTLELSLGGFLLGLERCLALVTVLLFFALLIHTTPATQLQGALYWLLRPLQRLGLPANRLSIRIALTLQKIHELQSHWSSASVPAISLHSWREIPERIGAFIHDVFIHADSTPAQTELTLETSAPAHWQWLLLVILVVLIIVIRFLSAYYL